MDRANTYCADPDCWQAVSPDPTISLNFCCAMCEMSFFGHDWGKKHGPNCSKRRRPPDYEAPRARPEPTDPSMPDARSEAQVRAALARRPERPWEATPPYRLIWRVVPEVIADEMLQQRLSRFLAKCWLSSLQEVSRGLAELQQRQIFTRTWVADTISRVYAVEQDLEDGPEDLVELFMRLSRQGGLPGFVTASMPGSPSADLDLVRETVYSTWNSVNPDEPRQPPTKTPRTTSPDRRPPQQLEQQARRVVLLAAKDRVRAPASPPTQPPPPAEPAPSSPAASLPEPAASLPEPAASLAESAASSADPPVPAPAAEREAAEGVPPSPPVFEEEDFSPASPEDFKELLTSPASDEQLDANPADAVDITDPALVDLFCASGELCLSGGLAALWRDLASGKDFCEACWEAPEGSCDGAARARPRESRDAPAARLFPPSPPQPPQ